MGEDDRDGKFISAGGERYEGILGDGLSAAHDELEVANAFSQLVVQKVASSESVS